jgi:DNA-binding MarR family transcriptional regulator
MKEVLGWHPKRANIAINLLVEEGKIKRVPDEKDRRVVRLCPADK